MLLSYIRQILAFRRYCREKCAGLQRFASIYRKVLSFPLEAKTKYDNLPPALKHIRQKTYKEQTTYVLIMKKRRKKMSFEEITENTGRRQKILQF